MCTGQQRNDLWFLGVGGTPGLRYTNTANVPGATLLKLHAELELQSEPWRHHFGWWR